MTLNAEQKILDFFNIKDTGITEIVITIRSGELPEAKITKHISLLNEETETTTYKLVEVDK